MDEMNTKALCLLAASKLASDEIEMTQIGQRLYNKMKSW